MTRHIDYKSCNLFFQHLNRRTTENYMKAFTYRVCWCNSDQNFIFFFSLLRHQTLQRVGFLSLVVQSVLYLSTKESPKIFYCKKKYQPKWQKHCGADPNYPMWSNSDQSISLSGIIRIISAKIAVLIFPHDLTHVLSALLD